MKINLHKSNLSARAFIIVFFILFSSCNTFPTEDDFYLLPEICSKAVTHNTDSEGDAEQSLSADDYLSSIRNNLLEINKLIDYEQPDLAIPSLKVLINDFMSLSNRDPAKQKQAKITKLQILYLSSFAKIMINYDYKLTPSEIEQFNLFVDYYLPNDEVNFGQSNVRLYAEVLLNSSDIILSRLQQFSSEPFNLKPETLSGILKYYINLGDQWNWPGQIFRNLNNAGPLLLMFLENNYTVSSQIKISIIESLGIANYNYGYIPEQDIIKTIQAIADNISSDQALSKIATSYLNELWIFTKTIQIKAALNKYNVNKYGLLKYRYLREVVDNELSIEGLTSEMAELEFTLEDMKIILNNEFGLLDKEKFKASTDLSMSKYRKIFGPRWDIIFNFLTYEEKIQALKGDFNEDPAQNKSLANIIEKITSPLNVGFKNLNNEVETFFNNVGLNHLYEEHITYSVPNSESVEQYQLILGSMFSTQNRLPEAPSIEDIFYLLQAEKGKRDYINRGLLHSNPNSTPALSDITMINRTISKAIFGVDSTDSGVDYFRDIYPLVRTIYY